MKGINKSFSMLTVSLLLFSVFVLCSGVSVFAAADKNLSTSLKYAVQHIWKVNIIKDSSNVSGSIVSVDSMVKVNTNNFVVSKNRSWNKIEWTSATSSILWWGKNVISSSENSTVVAWWQNTVSAATSIVWWWVGNQIGVWSDNAVIIWWNSNSIAWWTSSSVVWWYRNRIEWEYSAVAWSNNSVIWDYSVALWSWSKVIANNSFLWSDGSSSSMLKTDDVFAVMSQNGVIVNGSESLPWVQLTISGSLIVGQNNENDVNIQCGNWEWAGSIKLVDKQSSTTQKCLCTCNWENWNSLLWNWQCQGVCDGTSLTDSVNPECWTWLTLLSWDDWKLNFLWTCLQWDPVEWSYYMIPWTNSTGRINWACQWTNGVTEQCSYKVNCLWDIPSNAHMNNSIIPNIDKEYRYGQNDDNGVVCSFSCNDWYLWTWGICKQICNYASESCDVWTKTYPSVSWTKDYYYDCNYVYKWNNTHYSCNMSCWTNQIRAWASSWCVNKDLACDESTTKYTCNLWIVDDESKGMTVEDFVWTCVDSRWGVVKYCSTPKPIIYKDVYYNTSKLWLDETAWFSVSGSIATWIRIVLPYETDWWSASTQFTIQANQTGSNRETYNSTNGNITLKWPYLVNDKLPVWEVLYKLTIVNGEMNLCAGSCSVAGQCLYWATTSNFNSALNWNTATFTWKCSNGTKTDSCSATCNVNTSSCTSKPSNASDCDPVSDSDCTPLAWWTINLNDFYMYNASEIISTSSCWRKRHCVKSWSYIDYSITDNYCTQTWFKCNDGYVLEWCSCNNICNTTTNPWTCRGWLSLEYSSATWKTWYTYTCWWYACSATCPWNKVWDGSSCVDKPNVCWWSHYNCTWWSTRTDYSEDEANHIYLWKCKLWWETTQCRECYTWYKLEWTVCVADTLSCAAWTYSGYTVPALAHWWTAGVLKDDNSTHCTATATCNNSVISISWEDCSWVCNTTTNPWTCNLWLTASNYTWTEWWYNYKYSCWGGYSDCTAMCPIQTIWSWWANKCVSRITDVCNNTGANPSITWCIIWYYSQVSSWADWWVWNCLDANDDKLNWTTLCHKCKTWYSWNSSSNKCMNSVEIKVSCKRTQESEVTNYDIWPWFETDHTIEFEFDKNAPKNIDVYISYEVERSWWSNSDGKTITISSGSKKWSDVITSHDDNCKHDNYYWLNTNFSRSVPSSVTVWNTIYTFKKWTTDTCEGDMSYDDIYNDYCWWIDPPTCESPYFETLEDCNSGKPVWEYKCISSWDSDCPYKYTKKASCTSPCWWWDIESWKSKTCYSKANVQCPDTCVKNSQERTCNDWLWDEAFWTSFTGWSCTLKPKTCSTYPLSSCPEHWVCTSCVNYSVNWSSCTKWTTWYKLDSCNSGYTVSNNICVWKTLSCGWSKPSSHVTVWTGTYTYSGTIRSWTNITSWTPWLCQFKCSTNYVYSWGNCITGAVSVAANVKNTVDSCNITWVTAFINGSSTTWNWTIVAGWTDTLSFGASFIPWTNYSITLTTNNGTCNLSWWSTSTIDQNWWLWGSTNGRGYYWNCSCSANL